MNNNYLNSKEIKMFTGEISQAGIILAGILAGVSMAAIAAGATVTSGAGGVKIITVPAGADPAAVQTAVFESLLTGLGDSGLGSCAGGIAGMLQGILASITFLCFLSREVYGYRNEEWLLFRKWLLTKAPKFFIKLYSMYGVNFAKFISNKPTLKNKVKKLMDLAIV